MFSIFFHLIYLYIYISLKRYCRLKKERKWGVLYFLFVFYFFIFIYFLFFWRGRFYNAAFREVARKSIFSNLPGNNLCCAFIIFKVYIHTHTHECVYIYIVLIDR